MHRVKMLSVKQGKNSAELLELMVNQWLFYNRDKNIISVTPFSNIDEIGFSIVYEKEEENDLYV